MLCWLPIAAWAAVTGRAIPGSAGEFLSALYGLNVRFLVAIPLLIIAEFAVHAASARLLPQFATTGLVPPDELPAMRALIIRLARLRDAVLPWIAILGIVVAGLAINDTLHGVHEVEWTREQGDGAGLGFGGWWFLYVGRPVYLILLLGWVWRVILLFMLFGGLARLRLFIVPTHPDRTGGLGFLVGFPAAFAPVVLALGPTADVSTLYTAVTAMRMVPLSKASVLPLVLAASIPMLMVLALEVPLGQMLANVVKALL